MARYGEANGSWLESHRWRDRLFLVFAPSPEDDAYRRQRSLLEGVQGGFAERDLLRGDFFEESASEFDGEPATSGEASEVRRRYGVNADGFSALLVGKDGTVKRRFDEPVPPEDLYAQIDAMPMRRREMRER